MFTLLVVESTFAIEMNRETMKPVLDRKIKLIWDFRGPQAARTAEHYQNHLAEFVTLEELKHDISGFEHFSAIYAWHLLECHFTHWCFVCGIITGYHS